MGDAAPSTPTGLRSRVLRLKVSYPSPTRRPGHKISPCARGLSALTTSSVLRGHEAYPAMLVSLFWYGKPHHGHRRSRDETCQTFHDHPTHIVTAVTQVGPRFLYAYSSFFMISARPQLAGHILSIQALCG